MAPPAWTSSRTFPPSSPCPPRQCQGGSRAPTRTEPLMRVEWAGAAEAALAALLADGGAGRGGSLWPFASAAELRRALQGTLALDDIRSPLQRERHPNPGPGASSEAVAFFRGDLWFHELHVRYALLPAPPGRPGAAPASVLIEGVEPRGAACAARAAQSSED
ncbi:unnamed protein product [Prorocentrum cordatum]|uniref:Uncharacterized protein n=1 Tax=Prorocentrum cordatum TaxID=2364126 RepID=A0ABN9UXG7_9DINO|nr:unnamed protein product [Polarella glacialis]